VALKRQVTTQWKKVGASLADLAERGRPEGGFLVVETCGMNAALPTTQPVGAGDFRPGHHPPRRLRKDRAEAAGGLHDCTRIV
jgi:hypothetical protein